MNSNPAPFALLALLLATLSLPAQSAGRGPLSHDDYDSWPALQSVTPSADGAWLAYRVAPQQGDAVLEVRQVDGDTVHRFPRGGSPQFTADSRFVVFGVGESKEAARSARIEKLREAIENGEEKFTEPKKDPDASLVELHVLDLGSGAVVKIPRVESFQLAKETGFVAYVPKPAKKPAKNPEKKPGEKADEKPGSGAGGQPPATESASAAPGVRKDREALSDDEDTKKKGFQPRDGKPLVIRELATGDEERIEWVLSHRLVAEDRWLVYEVQKKPVDRKAGGPTKDADLKEAPEQAVAGAAAAAEEPAKEPANEPAAAAGSEASAEATAAPVVDQGLFALELATGRRVALLDGPANFGGFVTDREHRKLALWTDLADKDAKHPEIAIHLWDFSGGPTDRLIAADDPAIPAGKRLSKSGLGFSRDGSVLTLAVEDDPTPPIPPILAEDEVVLDLWHWKDGAIQPMQGKRRGSSDDRWTTVCFLQERRVVVLGDDALPSMRLITDDGSRALATDSDAYDALVSWDGRYADVFVVNTVDGAREKLLTRLRGSASASPTGRFVTWFDGRQWHAVDLSTFEDRELTAGIERAFADEDDDTPDPARAYGIAGWIEGDTAVVLYDRYDLWKVDPRTGDAACLTDGYGRANRIVLRSARIDLQSHARADDEEPRWLPETILLSAFDERTKASCYYIDSTSDVLLPRRVVRKDARISGLQKPKRAARLFYTVETFARFPDVWTANLEFGDEKRLTDANPRLAEVRWGRAELVEWRSADGIPLQGKLVFPDGFDPARKYPMLVYFYEKLSNNLHRHVAPRPGTSPNAAFYVSNGYLWFEPDIVYREGYPGESALKCVVPGVQSLIARGFVDEAAIGIAGHSWGGYQTAYLVTKTDLFAAAESGAPVSNMISAYGGIRWGSGMSRQFQYEQTQSRIGGTPWQYPLRYMENSPIFFADKVNTPVLILHNDRDGAVPWYQGIEYFMALRRLGKEAYLFDYVGEDHGLRKRQNQRDWTRRMQEFFDHRLKGAPAPRWMVEGVRFEDRAREKIEHAPSYIEATTAPAVEAEEPSELGIGAGASAGGQ